MQETWVRSLGQEDPLEKDMATHPSILAWEIPWTEEAGRVPSMGSQRVRRSRSDLAHTHTRLHQCFQFAQVPLFLFPPLSWLSLEIPHPTFFFNIGLFYYFVLLYLILLAAQHVDLSSLNRD